MSEPDASFTRHGQDLPGVPREGAGDGFREYDNDNRAVRLTLPQVPSLPSCREHPPLSNH
jgi:hypothetical protein